MRLVADLRAAQGCARVRAVERSVSRVFGAAMTFAEEWLEGGEPPLPEGMVNILTAAYPELWNDDDVPKEEGGLNALQVAFWDGVLEDAAKKGKLVVGKSHVARFRLCGCRRSIRQRTEMRMS